MALTSPFQGITNFLNSVGATLAGAGGGAFVGGLAGYELIKENKKLGFALGAIGGGLTGAFIGNAIAGAVAPKQPSVNPKIQASASSVSITPNPNMLLAAINPYVYNPTAVVVSGAGFSTGIQVAVGGQVQIIDENGNIVYSGFAGTDGSINFTISFDSFKPAAGTGYLQAIDVNSGQYSNKVVITYTNTGGGGGGSGGGGGGGGGGTSQYGTLAVITNRFTRSSTGVYIPALLTVSGNGFAPNNTITLQIGSFGFNTPLGTAQADGNGNIYASFTMSTFNLQAGSYLISSPQASNGQSITITQLSAPTQGVNPKIITTATSASIGTPVYLQGSGFTPNGIVHVSQYINNSMTQQVTGFDAQADGSGNWSMNANVAASIGATSQVEYRAQDMSTGTYSNVLTLPFV